jgi:hypothetical protein
MDLEKAFLLRKTLLIFNKAVGVEVL